MSPENIKISLPTFILSTVLSFAGGSVLTGVTVNSLHSLNPNNPTVTANTVLTSTPRRANTPAPGGDAENKIHGNKNSMIFHVPGCPDYNRISEKNLVIFESVEEAVQAGYRKARNC